MPPCGQFVNINLPFAVQENPVGQAFWTDFSATKVRLEA
jgi:hypothetical protein